MSPMHERVVKSLRDGRQTKHIAEVEGISTSSVRRIKRGHGLKLLPHRAAPLRQIVEDMRPIDAVEYLIGVIEQLEAVKPRGSHPIDGIGVHWTETERRILVALYDANGPLSRDAIFNALYFDRADADDLPSHKIIDVMVFKIRRKLPAEFGAIKAEWAYGYRFEAGQ